MRQGHKSAVSLEQSHSHLSDAVSKDGYRLSLSDELNHPEWDTFLVETPGGHHVQTSFWGQVKALLGWRPLRIIVRQQDQIVAGAQMLLRSLPVGGSVGYITKGPVLAQNSSVLRDLIIAELLQVAKKYRVQFLVVQPPDNGQQLAHQLPDQGFQPSSVEVAPFATVRIDLSDDLDTILARMKSRTRYNIRRGHRKDIIVRAGTEDDLLLFHQMLESTGQRKDFLVYPIEYFSKLWHLLNPHGYVKLFLAEYESTPVSGLLLVSFGDTVIYKKGAWSGLHGDRRPNEVLHWEAIKWAKASGFRYYDFEGIEPEAARCLQRGEPLPDSLNQSVTSFKVDFGGQAALFPQSYEYINNPLLRWGYNVVLPKVKNWIDIDRVLNILRTR